MIFIDVSQGTQEWQGMLNTLQSVRASGGGNDIHRCESGDTGVAGHVKYTAVSEGFWWW